MTIAKQLQSWRARKGLSQSQAAKVLKVNLKSLQNWEASRYTPNGKTAVRIVGAMR